MDRREVALGAIRSGISERDVAAWLLLLTPTAAFEGRERVGYEIIAQVAEFFEVSLRAVHVCGSAKLGFSPIKGSVFREAESDLDIAVIDERCFLRYLGAVLDETKQYADLTGFPRDKSGNPTYASFAKYVAKGVLRPDLMPAGECRRRWFDFFNDLSARHTSIFSSVSAGIYLSDASFCMKQSSSIATIWAEGGAI